MRYGVVCLGVATAMAAATLANAQVRVVGTVRNPDGTPLAGATVVIVQQVVQTTTDANGGFAFEKVTAGEYVRLSVRLNGKILVDKVALVTSWVERVDIDIPPPPVRPESRRRTQWRDPPPKQAAAPTTESGASGLASPVPGVGSQPAGVASPVAVAIPRPADAPPVLGGSGGMRGVVRSPDGLAIPGATVSIEGTDEFAVSDTEGRFSLVNLKPQAQVSLIASAPGFEPARIVATVPNGAPGTADFVLPLEAYNEAVTVSAEVPMLKVSGATSEVTLRPEQVASLPSLGEKDLFRALQLLPGVTGTQESSSGLYVRGGTPDQNLVSFDAFTLYHVEHLYGFFSAFNMDAVDQVQFSKSAFNAADGGRLSGVLRLTGKSKAAPRPSGFLNVSMLSAGGLFSVPLGSRGSVLIAGRRSYQSPLYNDILGLFNTSGPRGGGIRLGGGGSGPFQSTPTSWFYDANAKLDFKITGRDGLSASAYDGRDDLDNSRTLDFSGFTPFRGFPGQDTTTSSTTDLPSDLEMVMNDYQHWTNRGFGLTWKHTWGAKATTTASAGTSRYVNVRRFSSSLTSKSTGEDYSLQSGRGGNGGQAQENQLEDLTVRLDNTLLLGRSHQLSFGLETTSLDISYSAQTEVVQGMGPAGGFNRGLVGLLDQSGTGRTVTAYAQDTWIPSARLVVTPGVRVTRYDVTSQSFVEPRLSANYQLTSRFQLKGGYGTYHQVANRIQQEDLSQGDREFWVLADGTNVPIPRSWQVAVGGSYETEGFLIDVEAYHKRLDDLTMFAPRLIGGQRPEEGASYLYHGSSTARGVEMLFQKKFGVQTGWISYTLSQVLEDFRSLEADPFLASHDQRHELKITDSIKLGTWTIGASWAFGSGRPYTPAEGIESVEIGDTGITVDRLTYGAKNSATLPLYHRLDLSTQGDFQVWGTKSTIGVTVFNVYNRQNVWYRTYQTFGGSGAANDVTFMGRAFNLFYRIGF